MRIRYNAGVISIALAVFNEESVLQRCLSSVASFADEIVIVDGGSTDRTVEIARSFGAKVIQTTNPPIFHINKQKALEACSHDWILQLDADEVVPPALAKEIQQVVAQKHTPLSSQKKRELFLHHQANTLQISAKEAEEQYTAKPEKICAYFLPRLNHFLGGTLRHGGVYPDGVIRLVRKGKARFPCKSVHEQIEVDGPASWVSSDLDHFGDPSFSRYLLRANRYTSLTAAELKQAGVSRGVLSLLQYTIIKPISTFFWLYIRHKGALDGFPGFVFALFSGLHHAIAYLKYEEMFHTKPRARKKAQ